MSTRAKTKAKPKAKVKASTTQDPKTVTGFDVHSHRCKDPDCGKVWTHERLRNVSEQKYEQAHECPGCGKVQYFRHYGPDAAQLEPPKMPRNPFEVLRMLMERVAEEEQRGDA